MEYIRVTNGTETDIEGRYAGQDYMFKSGVPTDVPAIVATHVFGFNAGDKMPVLARLGWLSTSDQTKASIEKLRLIRMEAVEMVGHVVDDDEDELPAETAAMVPERIAPVSPNTSGGGSAAGGLNPPAQDPMSADGANLEI